MSNMVVRTNVMALNSHRHLGMVGVQQQRASQRLSSGFRINSAADDAAGLGISEKMRAQIRGLNQASRNAQDGISLIQTAEGAMNTVNDMVIRIRELVIQAANDTNAHNEANAATWSQSDRIRIQDEINQLLLEIDQVAFRTQFNTRNLLDGTLADVSVPAMSAALRELVEEFLFDNAAQVTAFNTAATNHANALTARDVASDAVIQLTLLQGAINNTVAAPNMTSVLQTIADDWLAGNHGSTILTDSSDAAQHTFLIARLEAELGITGLTLTDLDATVLGGAGGLTGLAHGDFTANDLTDLRNALAVAASNTIEGITAFVAATGVGTVGDIALADFAAIATAIGIQNGHITTINTAIGVLSGLELAARVVLDTLVASDADLNAEFGSFAEMMEAFNQEDIVGGALWFQIGANQGQGVHLSIQAVTVGQLSAIGTQIPPEEYGPAEGFSLLDLWTGQTEVVNGQVRLVVGSQRTDFGLVGNTDGYSQGVMRVSGDEIDQFITGLDFALGHVLSQRSNLGAMQNRLEYTIENLDIASENLSAANSRIRDADMALEMMRLTQANVLQQAATAMLAQANQAPHSILQLLG